MGARGCDEQRFDRIVNYITKKDDCYAIGLGDYADLILRQDLKRFTGSVAKRELLDMLDSMLNEQTNLVERKLKPLIKGGKLLGLGEGNHEYTTKQHHSFDITKEVCNRLNVPFMGYSWFLRLVIKKKSCNVVRTVIIYGHHGYGGGRTTGGSMNKLEQSVKFYNADIFLSAHDHQKVGKRLIRLGVTAENNPKIIHKPVIIAKTGTFLKTCEQGDTTYAERLGFPPTDLGVVKIKIGFEGRDKRLNLHVSE